MTAEQPLREGARLRRRIDPRSGTKANVGPHKNAQPREGEGARHRRRPEYPQETQLDKSKHDICTKPLPYPLPPLHPFSQNKSCCHPQYHPACIDHDIRHLTATSKMKKAVSVSSMQAMRTPSAHHIPRPPTPIQCAEVQREKKSKSHVLRHMRCLPDLIHRDMRNPRNHRKRRLHQIQYPPALHR